MTSPQTMHHHFDLQQQCTSFTQSVGEVETMRRFIDDITHELINPLAAVKMRLYLLRRNPNQLDEHLPIVESQIFRLEHLAGELRALTRIDRGEPCLQRAELDMNGLVAGVIEAHRPLAASKNQHLEFRPFAALPPIVADSRHCERIVVNLVANALHYTPENGRVAVSTAVETGAITLSVSDTGIGIASEDLPHIFERFYRTSRAAQTDSDGSGLGLAIVKEIVELHGGRIDVKSEVDQGTTFTVHLPLKPPSRSAQWQ